MKLLLTYFESFNGEQLNASKQAVSLLPDVIENCKIIKRQLPVVFNNAGKLLIDLIKENKPDIVLCLGQAGGRTGITPERIAVNVMDATIKDNSGRLAIDEKCQSDGPLAYESKLPIKDIVNNIKACNIPSYLSNSAGTFVCNNVMYDLLYYIDHYDDKLIGGFVHVPYIAEQVLDKENTFALSTDDVAKGIEISIKTIINKQK